MIVITLLALVLKLLGFFFIFAAALGVLRFKDPLQRMHAATKSGTIGAGLMVIGAACASGDGATIGIAAITVFFLVVTVPIAGHLLGRAIYISGAPLVGIEGNDALEGVLERVVPLKTED